MTNKDILEQICHDCPNRGDCGSRSRGLTDECLKIEVADYVAEVKDQQFKEYLENTIKAYKCRGEKFFAAEIKVLEEIINELFKED